MPWSRLLNDLKLNHIANFPVFTAKATAISVQVGVSQLVNRIPLKLSNPNMHKGCVHITQRQPDPPFITEINLSKSSLAKHMCVSRNSIKAWHRLAYLMIRTYREQFPLLNPNNPIAGRNTFVFFTPYQCWVIGRVRWVMRCYRNYDVAKLYIKQNLHLFSIETFLSIFNEFKGVA